MISANLDDFYLTAEQLTASPSRADGVDEALEAQLRRYGCDVVAEAGVLLALPQAVVCTAQVLIHRFYCKRSLSKFDIKVMAMAAFWLAAKLEEVIEIDDPGKLKLRDVLMVCYRVMRRRESRPLDLLDPYSRRYDELKGEVVRGERHMLRAFGFVVHVEHPHRFVLTFGQLLGLGRDLLQEGWNLANDSLRTSLCVRHKAEVVACGVLFTAARRQGVPMPEAPPWWELFGVSRAQLVDVCRTLAELYSLPRAQYVALGEDVTVRGAEGPVLSPAAATPPQLQSPASTAPLQSQPPVAAAEPMPPAAPESTSKPPAPNGEPPANGRAAEAKGEDERQRRRRRSNSQPHRSRSRSRSRDRKRRHRSRSSGRDRGQRREERDSGRKRSSRDYSRERDRGRDRDRDRSRRRSRGRRSRQR